MAADVEKDYYHILGISPLATPKEIRRAHRRLARRYHPDSRSVDTPTTLFHEVQEAYSVLSDSASRRAYDRQRVELGRGNGAVLATDVLLSRKVLPSEHEEQVLYVLVEVRPAVAAEGDRLPLDLCVVIDRSTSMKGARLENVKAAAHQIVDQLDDDDTLTIVSFNDRADVVLSDRVGSSRAQTRAAITALRAEGGTELLQGFRAGLAEVGTHLGRDAVSHLVLLTDGRTFGDDEACVVVAEAAGERGIGVTAMGIGEDWNDDLLDEIASRSGGTSAYIASPDQVRTALQGAIRSLGSVFATGIGLTVRSADGVRVEGAFRTSPSLERLHLADGTTPLGSLGVDTPLRVLLEVGIARRSPGKHRLLQIEINGDVPQLDRRDLRVKQDVWCALTDEGPSESEAEVPLAVLRALGRITLYRMQEQAWSALAEGQVDRATRQLEMVATRLFDMGEERLAQAAMLEAEHVARRGSSTSRGRKRIKYGTRSLRTKGEEHD